jgi:hypothetical protein
MTGGRIPERSYVFVDDWQAKQHKLAEIGL